MRVSLAFDLSASNDWEKGEVASRSVHQSIGDSEGQLYLVFTVSRAPRTRMIQYRIICISS